MSRELAQALEHINVAAGHLGEIARQLTTQRGAPSPGADYRVIVNGTAGSLSASRGRLAGFAIREVAQVSAPAVVRLYDGIDTGGDLIMPIALQPKESAREWFLPTGIGFANGLYVEIVSGAIEGVVFLGPQP